MGGEEKHDILHSHTSQLQVDVLSQFHRVICVHILFIDAEQNEVNVALRRHIF